MDNIGKSASGLQNDDLSMDKFTLQAAARELSDNNALRACLRVPVPNYTTVDIIQKPSTGRVFYAHLCTCKLVWLCPICAARISARRTAELLEVLTEPVDQHRVDPDGSSYVYRKLKYHVGMVTFTVGHKHHSPLSDSMKIIKKSYHAMFSGRQAQRFMKAYDIIGSVRAFEVTWGYENGWHPHIHTLLVSNAVFDVNREIDLIAVMSPRWVEEVENHGGYATLANGLTVSRGEESLIKYIDKSGQQIARVKLKPDIAKEIGMTPAKRAHGEHRTLWQLLADYVRGDWFAGKLWIDAQRELRGTRQLVASPAFKALMRDPDALEDSIAGIENIEKTDILLASLTLEQWRLVNRWGLRGQLLKSARESGAAGVTRLIEKLEALHSASAFVPS